MIDIIARYGESV